MPTTLIYKSCSSKIVNLIEIITYNSPVIKTKQQFIYRSLNPAIYQCYCIPKRSLTFVHLNPVFMNGGQYDITPFYSVINSFMVDTVSVKEIYLSFRLVHRVLKTTPA